MRVGGEASLWHRELSALLIIGVPMALTQLIQFSITTIDVLMIGKLGPEALAGASLGLVIYYAFYVCGMGPAMAVSPMVAQALGADKNDTRDVRRSVRMGFWAIILISPALLIPMLFTTEIANLFGQPEGPARLAEPYVLALAPGLPFALFVIALRNFLAAIERTRAPLVFIIATTFLNAFLNWVLIYGNLGAPRLELVGAGIASSISHAAGFALMVVYIIYERESRRFEIFKNLLVIEKKRLLEVSRLAWPIAITMLFEVMLFNACVLLMGRIGVDEMAAYQVALNVAAFAFMAPLGLSIAGATRVGLMAGAQNLEGVRRAATVSIATCIVIITVFATPMLLAPYAIAALYLDASIEANFTVISLVAAFLPIAAAFALFDATQVAANQALRGLKDVRIPMILTFISYWVIGFPIAAWTGLATPLGARGVWFGLLFSLIAAAILLGGRLWMITRDPSHLPKAE